MQHLGKVFRQQATQAAIQQELIYKKYLELYEQTQLGEIDDLEALARLAEYGASLTPDCAACFVDNMGAVLTGYTGFIPGYKVILNRLRPDDFPLNQYYQKLRDANTFLGQEGFAPILRDNSGRGNQSRHFWQYVQTAFFQSWNVAVAGNAYHETLDPSAKGKSYHDFALGVEGANLGFNLFIGAVSPDEVGQYIRDQLSKHSYSAEYWNNPYNPCPNGYCPLTGP